MSDIKMTEPQWDFPALADVDLIGGESAQAVAYLFDIEKLEKVEGIYSDPVFAALLKGLYDLSQSSDKELRECTFTVFAGDARSNDVFVLAVGTNSTELVNFLSPYFRAAPGYYTLEAGTSRDFLPVFRYDQGYVIQYQDFGLEGTNYLDTEDYYGSGLKIYRRSYMTPEQAGLSQTTYGRLKKNER